MAEKKVASDTVEINKSDLMNRVSELGQLSAQVKTMSMLNFRQMSESIDADRTHFGLSMILSDMSDKLLRMQMATRDLMDFPACDEAH